MVFTIDRMKKHAKNMENKTKKERSIESNMIHIKTVSEMTEQPIKKIVEIAVKNDLKYRQATAGWWVDSKILKYFTVKKTLKEI